MDAKARQSEGVLVGCLSLVITMSIFTAGVFTAKNIADIRGYSLDIWAFNMLGFATLFGELGRFLEPRWIGITGRIFLVLGTAGLVGGFIMLLSSWGK